MLNKFYKTTYYIFLVSILCTSFCYYYVSKFESDRWEYIQTCINYKEYTKHAEFKNIKDNYFEQSNACKSIAEDRLSYRKKHYERLKNLGLISLIPLCISGIVISIKLLAVLYRKVRYVISDNNSLKSQRYGLIIVSVGVLLLLLFALNIQIQFVYDEDISIMLLSLGVIFVISGFLMLFRIPQGVIAWAQKGK